MHEGSKKPVSSYRIPRDALIIHQFQKLKSEAFRPRRLGTPLHPHGSQRKPGFLGKVLAPVEEIFLAGGGGAGRSLIGAFREAMEYGLDFDNVKVVCGTSVGTIVALGMALNLTVDQMQQELDDLPTDSFQDWDILDSIINFNERWGLCRGETMPACFRELIKKITNGQLYDPTFKELFDAGYKKELRIVTTNLDRGDVKIFSHKTTPNKKVAEAVALSCSVPILFPPKWIVSADGKRELHTDGGVIKNYPFGVGSDPRIDPQKQLGFIFVNGATAKNLDGEHKPKIQSFLQYLAALLSTIVFQHPLTLTESDKQRTVAIQVNHNPFQFTATPEEQEELNKAGARGVRSLVHQLIKHEHTQKELARAPSPKGAKTAPLTDEHLAIKKRKP